jgi:hypothetical protein
MNSDSKHRARPEVLAKSANGFRALKGGDGNDSKLVLAGASRCYIQSKEFMCGFPEDAQAGLEIKVRSCLKDEGWRDLSESVLHKSGVGSVNVGGGSLMIVIY